MAKLATTHRFLPAEVPKFSLTYSTPVSVGLRDAALRQFDGALSSLSNGKDVDKAVHTSRKAMKRIRAMLRLVRPAIGDAVYRAENAYLRDTARRLSDLRDGRVMIDTVQQLRERFSSQLRPTAFAGVEEALVERADRLRAVAAHEGVLETTAHALRSARARYSAWPVEDGGPTHGYVPIPHHFDSIGGGLERVYRRGRDEMRTAFDHPTAHNFHLWRKRAKYLRYQSELLFPLWPDVMKGQVDALEHLGEVLGAEHDLAELLRLLVEVPDVCTDAVERTMLMALSQHRRRELQQLSRTMGTKVYAERPSDFRRRFRVYWEAWDAERNLEYVIDR